MAFEDPDELIRSLEALPVAAILTQLDTHTFIAVNEAAATLFGSPADELVGTDVLDRIDPRDREAATHAYADMAGGLIDGYQVRRRIVTPDGRGRLLSVSGRRVKARNAAYGLWILADALEPAAGAEMLVMGEASVVLAVTDHDWQIEYMSSDADLLGARGSDLRGFPLLGLVHPSVASEFLTAAARAATGHLAVTILTRMRAGPDRWAQRYCLMAPVCEDEPPRLGVVITAVPSLSDGGAELDGHVRHAALEAHASETFNALRSLVRLPNGSELSARQTEIVARLIAGQRAPEIARSMFLSNSTVRNHLVAIYRKFDVHSQAELLAALLRASTPHD